DCAWLDLRTTRFDPDTSAETEVQITSHVGIDAATAERIMASAEGFPEAARQIGSLREELESTRRAFVLRKKPSFKRQRSIKGAALKSNPEINSILAVPLLRRG